MTQTGEETPRPPLLQPPPSRPSAYERFVRLGVLAWAGIGVIVLAYLLLRLLVYVNPVVPPLLLAVVVVYLLNPVVTALERRGVPRAAGAGVVYVLFICLVALAVSLLIAGIAFHDDELLRDEATVGVFIAFTCSSHAIGSFSSAISFLASSGKPFGFAASLGYSFANGIALIISTVICGIASVNAGCHPLRSYATDATTSLFTFAGCRIASCRPTSAPIE